MLYFIPINPICKCVNDKYVIYKNLLLIALKINNFYNQCYYLYIIFYNLKLVSHKFASLNINLVFYRIFFPSCLPPFFFLTSSYLSFTSQS